jgi:hypothetical protein
MSELHRWLSVRNEGGDVVVAHRARERARMALAEVRVVGEMTTPDGAFGDDHVVVLVGRDASWIEVPTDAEGFDAWWAELARRLDAKLGFGLCNRVDWASRIAWPVEHVDEELFTFTELPPGPGLWARLRAWFAGRLRIELRPAVRGLVERAAPPAG